MTNKKEVAQKIWEAFCGELIQEPTDDMKEALATALREVVNQLQYYQCCRDQDIEDMVVDARAILDVADELEAL